MLNFKVEGNSAKIEADYEDYRIVVIVEPKNSSHITTRDAEIVLTKVMPLFPQKISFP